jgi:WD40 repeat protein
VVVDPVNGETVYSGSRDYHMKGWNTETGAKVVDFSVPRNIITTMTTNSSGSMVFQGSEDLCVRAWDVRSSAKTPAVHLTSYVYFPLSISMHSNDYYMVTGCKGFDGVGCEVKLWDLRKTAAPAMEMHGHQHDVTGCTFSKSIEHRIVSASKDGSICVWDTSTGSDGTSAATKHSKDPQGYQVTTGKYYTSLIQSNRSNSTSETYYIGSFDGSVSTVDVPRDAVGGGKVSISIKTVTAPYFTEGGNPSQRAE